MLRGQALRSTFIGLFALTGVVLSASTVKAQSEPTTADFYGTYELLLPGVEPGGVGNEMIAIWTEDGMTVEQMGAVVIDTQIALASTPGTMAIWSDSDPDPTCAAEGMYEYEDDGTTITLSLLSDECQGRARSADGAKLVRLD